MPTKNNIQLAMVWGVILFLLVITALGYSGYADDAYWHIKVGEWILRHHQVPNTGIFSYTNADTPWVSHEWLSAVLLYTVFQNTGWAGLVFLMIMAVFVSGLVLLWFLLQRLSIVQSLIFVLFAYLLLIPHILPRPHIFAIPLMAYWTACLIDASEKHSSPSFYMLPLMILWSNLHGSFIVGIAFSIFFAIEAIFYAATQIRKQLAYQWSIFVIFAVLCAAISPHGLNGLLLPFQLSNQSYILSRVNEWLSPNFHEYQPIELWLMAFLTLALLQGLKLPFFRLIFLLGLLHLSLKHQRHSSDLLSVLFPLILATPLAKSWNSKSEASLTDLLPKTYKGVSLLIIYFGCLFWYLTNQKLESDECLQTQEVLLTLKPEQQHLGNVFNSYGSAIFLIHLGYPVFVDSRNELYGDQFMKNYFSAIELSEGATKLNEMLVKYHITWTLFPTSYSLNTYLATQSQWLKLYSDKNITLFIHQSVKLTDKTREKLKQIEKSALVAQQKNSDDSSQ